MDLTIERRDGGVPPSPGLGWARGKSLAMLVGIGLTVAACGGGDSGEAAVATGESTEDATGDNDPVTNTTLTTEEPVDAGSSTEEALIGAICGDGEYIRGHDETVRDISYLYNTPVKRADNCTTASGGIVGLTFFASQPPASGPINHSEYCANGAVFTAPEVAYGDDGSGWIVEYIPTAGEPHLDTMHQIMEEVAASTGGTVETISCPENAEIEQSALGDQETAAPEEEVTATTTATGTSDGPYIMYEEGMEIIPGETYCVAGEKMFAEGEGFSALSEPC